MSLSYQQVPLDVSTEGNIQELKFEDKGGMSKRNMLILGLSIILVAGVVIMLSVLLNNTEDFYDGIDTQATRYYLDSDTGVCNDGTSGVYYVRRNLNSNVWVLYAQGAYLYCWDAVTCDYRLEDTPDYMSNTLTEETMELEGILSSDCEFNPHWCQVNIAFIKYCSSDLWTGSVGIEESGTGYHFRGYDILTESIDKLLTEHDMDLATEIMYSGKGGGGVGAFVTATRVEAQLMAGVEDPENIVVKHFMDTGWISDHDPYVEDQGVCRNSSDWVFSMSCNYKTAIEQGVLAWQPLLPDYCIDAGFTWECYFTEYTIADIKAQIDTFSFMWQYDSTQLSIDGLIGVVPDTFDDNQTDYALEFGRHMVDEVWVPAEIAGFIPDCFSHEMMESEYINSVMIGNLSFADALYAWFYDGDQTLYYDEWGQIDGNPTCPDNQPE